MTVVRRGAVAESAEATVARRDAVAYLLAACPPADRAAFVEAVLLGARRGHVRHRVRAAIRAHGVERGLLAG